jgi:hypothetical protein
MKKWGSPCEIKQEEKVEKRKNKIIFVIMPFVMLILLSLAIIILLNK